MATSSNQAEAFRGRSEELARLMRRVPAITSAALWHQLAWPQVAAIIADAARASDCAPGVRELLATIEIFGK